MTHRGERHTVLRHVLVFLSAFSLTAAIGALPPARADARTRHEISAVAPGRVVAGDEIRVYGRTFEPGGTIRITLSDQPSRKGFVLQSRLEIAPSRHVELRLPEDLPEGWYWLAASRRRRARRAHWVKALQVVPATETLDLEDSLPLPHGAIATARPIVPGQTVLGSWSVPGETDYFLLTSGAGAVRIGSAGSLTVTGDLPWPWTDPAQPEAAPPPTGCSGAIMASARFDPVTGVVSSLTSLGGR